MSGNDSTIRTDPDITAAVAAATQTYTALNAAHQADLAASGIPLTVATALGLRSADAAEVRRLLGRGHGVGSGLVIPYFDPFTGRELVVESDEGRVAYVRIRLDDPAGTATAEGEDDGAGAGDEDPAMVEPRRPKYLSRRGSGQYPYIIPELGQRLVAGAVEELLFTEGEKKAAAGNLAGLNVVGLSGHWAWKIKDQPDLHSWLEGLIRPGMRVIVIWDSDAALNTGFAASTRMLQDALRRKGVPVKAIVLPQPAAEKVGLDDYLRANDAASFRAFIDGAREIDGDRQADPDALMLDWIAALEPALRALPEAEGRRVVARAAAKGLLDGVPDALRVAAVERLAGWAAWDVRALVYDLARAAAVNAAPAAVVRGGPAAAGGAVIPVGSRVELSDGECAVVERTDRDLLWVGSRAGTGKSWPVLATAVQLVRRGAAAGADKVPAADLADRLLAEKYSEAGVPTLRHFRGRFYVWRQGSYGPLPDVEVAAEAMGLLREHYRAQATTSTVRNILANLRAAGAGHVDSGAEAPLWLDGGGGEGEAAGGRHGFSQAPPRGTPGAAGAVPRVP